MKLISKEVCRAEPEYMNIHPPISVLATVLLVITLLDLKNAFGEVHHNLIQSVLEYHHVPDHIEDIVGSLYTNFKTSVITSDFRTPFITVGRGVLQGDCLSPLLFKMCFNTFIQHIKVGKYRQFGFTLKFPSSNSL